MILIPNYINEEVKYIVKDYFTDTQKMLMLGTAIVLKISNDTTVFTIMIRCFNKLLKRYYESRSRSKTCK
jgi:hypothetical protein